jgi:hypothetical protein
MAFVDTTTKIFVEKFPRTKLCRDELRSDQVLGCQ